MSKAIHVVVRALFEREGHILMAYDPREKPFHYYELNRAFYYLPGGHVKWQESAPKALAREMQEEMGQQVDVGPFLGVIDHAWRFDGDEVCCHTHEINLVFRCHSTFLKPPVVPKQREAHVAFAWISLQDIDAVDVRPACLKGLLKDWDKDKGNTFVSYH
jgi:8-oxo-dGTP diphosphatase